MSKRTEMLRYRGDQPSPQNKLVMGLCWFPASEFPTAVEKWPALKESWGADTYEDYCRLLQQQMINLASRGIKSAPVPLIIDEYLAWCAERDRDPADTQSRSTYGSEQTHAGRTIAWPPGRNGQCWCGSGRKYKHCCGTITLKTE